MQHIESTEVISSAKWIGYGTPKYAEARADILHLRVDYEMKLENHSEKRKLSREIVRYAKYVG